MYEIDETESIASNSILTNKYNNKMELGVVRIVEPKGWVQIVHTLVTSSVP